MRRTTILTLVLSLTLLAPAHGQQRFRAGVDVFHIQVSVAGIDGEFVAGLDTGDFALRIDGEPREIVTAYSIDSDRPPASWVEAASSGAETESSDGAPETETPRLAGVERVETLPAAARRRFLIFLDLAQMSRTGMTNVRRVLLPFLEESVRPGDMLGVSVYSPRRGLEYIVPFTTRHDLVEDVVRGFGSGRAAERDDARSEGIPLDDVIDFYASVDGGGNEVAEFIDQIEEIRVEAAAEAMLSALGDLAESLRGADGRKYVLMFSRGLPEHVIADGGVSKTMEAFAETARRSDVVFHTFDPSNLAVSSVNDATSQEGSWQPGSARGWWDSPAGFINGNRGVLHFLARETGGEASFWRWGSKRGLEELERRTNDYYVLAFPLRPSDGDTIEIEVESLRSDVQVTWAPTELAIRAGSEGLDRIQRQFDVAEALELGSSRDDVGVSLRAWVLQSAGVSDAHVAIAVQVEPEALSWMRSSNDASRAAIEVLGLTVTQERRVLDYFRARAEADLSITVGEDELLPLRVSSWLRVPPGRHYVKVLLRESVSGRVFSDSLAIAVPEAEEPALRIERPLLSVPAATTPVLRGIPVSARGRTASGTPAEPGPDWSPAPLDPFFINGMPVAVDLSDTIRASDTVEVLLTLQGVTAHPANDAPRLSLSLALETPTGSRIPLNGFTVTRSDWQPGIGLLRVLGRAPLPSGLRSGGYVLHVLAADGLAGTDASSSLPLTILE